MDKLYLVGFAGSGKSTVGHILAHTLKIPFVDLDNEIELDTGMTCTEIFCSQGEQVFRALEKSVLISASRLVDACVVATGNGTPISRINRTIMRTTGVVIYLKANTETIYERLRLSQASGDSPNSVAEQLIENMDIARMRDFIELLFAYRSPYYQATANMVVATDNRAPDSISSFIIKQLDYSN